MKPSSTRRFIGLLLLPLVTPAFASIPTDGLVARYDLNGDVVDSVHGNNGKNSGAILTTDRFGKAGSAYAFDGASAYIEIPDADQLSIATTGKFSISVWLRPDVLVFSHEESAGYVHWMGKGTASQHEWTFRMYGTDNTSSRQNRTSFYAFNLGGKLGSGAYIQETVIAGAWEHLVATIEVSANQIKLYKNGVLRDTKKLSAFNVTPANGTAPLRLGTRDFTSYFKGALDNLLIYNRVLSAAEVADLYNDPTP